MEKGQRRDTGALRQAAERIRACEEMEEEIREAKGRAKDLEERHRKEVENIIAQMEKMYPGSTHEREPVYEEGFSEALIEGDYRRGSSIASAAEWDLSRNSCPAGDRWRDRKALAQHLRERAQNNQS